MKKLLSVLSLLSLVFVSCKKDNLSPPGNPNENCEVKGRWRGPYMVVDEFTDSMSYTIYQEPDGSFGSISESTRGHRWEVKGDTLIQYLSSTSIKKSLIEFDCDCNVMRLTNSWGLYQTTTNTHWREHYDISSCQ